MGMTTETGIVAIDHVGVAVADLEAGIAYYTQTLGLVELHREVNEEQGVAEAMVGLADGSGAQIQVLAPLNENSTIARFLEKNGPGIQQMAYRVANLDEFSAQLRAKGQRLLYPEPKRGTANSRINFIHPKDTGGILVELVEPADDQRHH